MTALEYAITNNCTVAQATKILAGKQSADKRGRPKAFEFSQAELALCRRLRLEKESINEAVHWYLRDLTGVASAASKDALQEYRQRALQKGVTLDRVLPMGIRRAFQVTDEEKAAFRNKKDFRYASFTHRRSMTMIDAQGVERVLLPGDLWEMDDYSSNQPYWLETEGEPHLCRQVLACLDVASAAWLGFDHIGRERDAYRGEDIARFFARCVRTHGLPKFIRLERGSWESTFVEGIAKDLPKGKSWGGWKELGITVMHAHDSFTKGQIEGSFSLLQRHLSHTGTDIGRVRGEFDQATKRARQAHAGSKHPKDLGFLHISDSSRWHEEAMMELNSRLKSREALGGNFAPEDLWSKRIIREVPAGKEWVLLPWKKACVVEKGFVDVSAKPHWSGRFRFQVNGLAPSHLAPNAPEHLPTGWRVLVAFDPARPDLGAYIANNDMTARNREHIPWGAPLRLLAPAETLRPQIDLSGQSRKEGADTARAARAAARTSYTGYRPAQPAREAAQYDGRGGVNVQANLADLPLIPDDDASPAPAPVTTPRPASVATPTPPQTRRNAQVIPDKVADRQRGKDAIARLLGTVEDDEEISLF